MLSEEIRIPVRLTFLSGRASQSTRNSSLVCNLRSRAGGFGLLSLITVVGGLILAGFLVDRYFDSLKGRVVLIDVNTAPRTEGNRVIFTMEDDVEIGLNIRRDPVPEGNGEECGPDFYREIGSMTFVGQTLDGEAFDSAAALAAETARLREIIEDRRDELESSFLSKYEKDEDISEDPIEVTCSATLQPNDRIFRRLVFYGPSSSNTRMTCLGDGDNRAQIRNPATTTQLDDKGEDPMLTFVPDNCGVESLSPDEANWLDTDGTVTGRCDPVKNVQIENCRVRGRTEATSMGTDLSRLSNIRSDYVQRLRESAPQNVQFNNVELQGRYKGPFHLRPGIHHFTIQNSTVLGGFAGITIHLPSDGGWNVIRDSTITGQRKKARFPWQLKGNKREVISIDSSEHNRIVNNHISDMKYGGIELYRNCGERASIRHRVPQYNQIINNVFEFGNGDSSRTIFLGSRDDKSMARSFGYGVKGYCHKDEGVDGERFPGNDSPEPWDTEVIRNSSESNSDWAQHNVIAENQLIGSRQSFFSTMAPTISLSSKAKTLDNYIIDNEFEHERSLDAAKRIQSNRGAGCAVLAGVTYGSQTPNAPTVRNGSLPYIRNGSIEKYFWDIRPPVELACGVPLECNDNRLEERSDVSCVEPLIRDFGPEAAACDDPANVCAEGDNDGDEHELGCTGNLLGIQAVCNLESGKATDGQRNRTLFNRVNVARASDKTKKGHCIVGDTDIREGQQWLGPWVLQAYGDSDERPRRLRHACEEHDKNGGDCHMNVRHYCEPFEVPRIE